MFHRGNPPCFFAFDLLTCNGKDLRTERLLDRKQELRRLLAKTSPPFPLRYAEHVERSGTALFERVCELDLEGIVAKQKSGPYVTEREHSTWFKILNREYTQKDGREELFERERHSELAPGWHRMGRIDGVQCLEVSPHLTCAGNCGSAGIYLTGSLFGCTIKVMEPTE